MIKLANSLLDNEVIFKSDLVNIFGERKWKSYDEEKLDEMDKEAKNKDVQLYYQISFWLTFCYYYFFFLYDSVECYFNFIICNLIYFLHFMSLLKSVVKKFISEYISSNPLILYFGFSENFGFNNKNQILIILSAILDFDSIAYLVGSKFGKNKMFIKISPKKSWEGFFSGFFAFLMYIYLVYLFAPDFLFEISSKIEMLKFSLIPITATAGDFYISHLREKLI